MSHQSPETKINIYQSDREAKVWRINTQAVSPGPLTLELLKLILPGYGRASGANSLGCG